MKIDSTGNGNVLSFARPSWIPAVPPPIFVSSTRDNWFSAEERYAGLREVQVITPESLEKINNEAEGLPVFTSNRGKLHFLVADPDHVRTVLIDKATSFVKGDQEAALSAAIGWGLIAEEGEVHRKHQSELGPGLRAKALENYGRAVEEVASAWIDRSLATPHQSLVDAIREFSQESAERSLFSSPRPHTDFGYHEAVHRVNSVSQSGPSSSLDGPAYVETLKKYREDRLIIQRHVRELVREATQRASQEPTLFDYLARTATHDDSSFSPLEQEVSLFLQAATETTASLISWTLLLLAQHPEYWPALFKEHSSNAEAGDTPLEPQASWTDAILKESLRLYPPAWMLPRIASNDVVVGGELIPRGARVVISPWVTHRSGSIFAEPNEFQPERFISRLDVSQRAGYFPFGLGGRICIGERYGMSTATILLRALATRKLSVSIDSPSLKIGSSSLLLIPNPTNRFSLRSIGDSGRRDMVGPSLGSDAGEG
jgi:enediyne biosynthesis protein E7